MINGIEGEKSLAIEKFLATIESGWQPWIDMAFSRSLSNLDLAFFFEFLGSLRVGIPGTRMASETVWEQRGSVSLGFCALGASPDLPMHPASAASGSCPARKIPREPSAAGILKRSLSTCTNARSSVSGTLEATTPSSRGLGRDPLKV